MSHLTKFLFLFVAFPLLADVTVDGEYAVFDGKKISFGELITVVGQCKTTEEDYYISGQTGPILVGLRVNGLGNQDEVEFHLLSKTAAKKGPKSLTKGQYVSVRGRLRDSKIDALRKIFTLDPDTIELISPAPLKIADFVDRSAIFYGTAAADGNFSSGDETAKVKGLSTWPASIQAKEIEVHGIIRKNASGLVIEQIIWKLVALEDQIGQEVSLDGGLWSMNGKWWFEYREQSVYLTSDKGPVMTFSGNDHGRKIRVKGKLLRQLRPSLEQITLKNDRDLVQHFVVRGAKVEFLDNAVHENERFRAVYAARLSISDGVPLLLAEHGYRRNFSGTETSAMLFMERNLPAIQSILQNPSPATIDVLARRLADKKLQAPLRLLYAAMLAACNDERGRTFLVKSVENRKAKSFPDALYCLGIFPFLPSEGSSLQSDIDWAEPLLIALLSSREPFSLPQDYLSSTSPETVSDAAILFSDIPQVLIKLRTVKARDALVNYCGSGGKMTCEVIQMLCSAEEAVPTNILKKLGKGLNEDDDRSRYAMISIVQKLLKQRDPSAVDLFPQLLSDGFLYMDFRDALNHEIAAALQLNMNKFSIEGRAHARMLVLLAKKDPVPELIALLGDPKWEDKNLVLYELARLKDARSVNPVSKILRNDASHYFQNESAMESAIAIEHALKVLANIGSDDAIQTLIFLLDTDFGRAKGIYLDNDGLHRIIAAHLIELTGESFGTDSHAWKKWWASRSK